MMYVKYPKDSVNLIVISFPRLVVFSSPPYCLTDGMKQYLKIVLAITIEVEVQMEANR